MIDAREGNRYEIHLLKRKVTRLRDVYLDTPVLYSKDLARAKARLDAAKDQLAKLEHFCRLAEQVVNGSCNR